MFPTAPYFEEQKVARRLQGIYRRIPAGNDPATNLCQKSGEAVLLEFLDIANRLLSFPNKEEIIKKAINFELLHWGSLDYGCPFSDAGSCMLESAKPLYCRLFGFFPPSEFESIKEELTAKNRELRKYFSNSYGISLPKESSEFLSDPSAGEKDHPVVITDERRKLYTLLYDLQNELLNENFINSCGTESSITSYLIRMSSDIEDLEKLRIQALKSLLKEDNREKAESIGLFLIPEILETLEDMVHKPGLISLVEQLDID